MNTTSKSDSVPTHVESVANMIDRLGEPPGDIWDRLVVAAEAMFPDTETAASSSNSIRSPSHAFWQSHGVDRHGQLIGLTESDAATEPSLEEDRADSEPTDDEFVEPLQLNDPAELTRFDSKPKRSFISEPILIGAIAAIVLLGAAFLWWPSSEPGLAQTSSDFAGEGLESKEAADVFDAGFIATNDESAMELGTLMDSGTLDSSASADASAGGVEISASEIVEPSPVAQSSTGKPSTAEASEMTSSAFSLDDLIPAPVATESSSDEEAGEVDQATTNAVLASEDVRSASFGGGEEADVMSDGDADDMDSDAVTGSTEASMAADSQTFFVSLPPLPIAGSDAAQHDSWPVSSWTNTGLGFPGNGAAFSISDARVDGGSILRTSDQTAIATFRAQTDEKESRLEWLPGALDADRKALLHGRMELAAGRRVYLRPSLRGDAIPVDLAERDGKRKWDLEAPPEPKRSRLSMNLEVPEGVDVGWIEPIENASPRKVRGIAVLSQQDSESVAVVVRVDVQTTRMMTVRVRFGARLDPSMPWQWTDRTDVSQTLAAVTRQMELADLRHTELEAAISRAESSRARRLEARLDQQLDQLESQQKSWKMFAERLAELDQLIATLAGQASLSAELFVSWPDDEQPILRLTSADG
ncbi:hypothetical protein [Rhodopirellula sp. P2]|uniref:hypothetical protein n=1 Tax=Rhodopirellula sp. P2 TaxID=2127060 RepID=UPI00236850FB|nr:hypothetical protein [Rhodopirellula sp. P2]WDQ16944.1 hypothetical protein PSR62_25545 [Rhodopirellula sp. P2]